MQRKAMKEEPTDDSGWGTDITNPDAPPPKGEEEAMGAAPAEAGKEGTPKEGETPKEAEKAKNAEKPTEVEQHVKGEKSEH